MFRIKTGGVTYIECPGQAAEMESFKVVSVPAINETELVIRAQHGERNAFSELVRLHAHGVMHVVYRMCGNVQVAEGAAQETFIQAWLLPGSWQAVYVHVHGLDIDLS